MFISEDFPAPFSPSSACTSPQRAEQGASGSAAKPAEDLRMPGSSRALGIVLLLRDHALDVPVHLPQVGVGQRPTGGHTLLAAAVRQRAGVELPARQAG